MNDDGTVIAVPIEIDELPSEGRDRLDELFRSDPLMHQLGGSLVSWSPGQSTVTASIDKSHTNFIGGGHGGIGMLRSHEARMGTVGRYSSGDCEESHGTNGGMRKNVRSETRKYRNHRFQT